MKLKSRKRIGKMILEQISTFRTKSFFCFWLRWMTSVNSHSSRNTKKMQTEMNPRMRLL